MSSTTPSTASDLRGFYIRGQPYGGFTGSEWVTNQTVLQTVDATPAVITQIPLNEDEAIIVNAYIVGCPADHSGAAIGTVELGCRRMLAGNITDVGVAAVNVQSDNLTSFTIQSDIPTQSVQIVVTGLLFSTINWVCTYSYQKMLSDAL